MSRRAVVTGAFSYTGAAVASVLAGRGWQIHTLTNRRPPRGGARGMSAAPLAFEPAHLERELRGADALVSTYWVRFPHAGQSFDTAVAKGRMLFEAARRAGVPRIVHVSVSNADLDSSLDYYRGKAKLDQALRDLGVPHGIVRPTLVIGPDDILTNNIAWFLRRFPLFGLPAGGGYRLQPIVLEDCGRIIADAVESPADLDWDASGSEIYTFRQFVSLLAEAAGIRRLLLPVPSWLALASLRTVEPFLRDIILTRQELAGLMEERLLSGQPPRGFLSVREWLLAAGDRLGRRYANDLRRHFGDERFLAVPGSSPGR